MTRKPYNRNDHRQFFKSTEQTSTSVWCEACGCGFGLSENGVRHATADVHEKLVGQPHVWFDRDQEGNIVGEQRTCGNLYELKVWNWTARESVCTCGAPAPLQYDQFGCMCGYMCDEKFLNTYRQDRYDPADYGERIEPLD